MPPEPLHLEYAEVSARDELGWVELVRSSGIWAPRQVDISLGPRVGVPYAVQITVRPIGGRLEAVDMAVAQVEGGVPVTRSGIIALPITDLVSRATGLLAADERGRDVVGVSEEEWTTLRQGRLNDDALPAFVLAYRIVRATEPNPAQRLARDLEVGTATISRRLSRAVEVGLLNEWERDRRKASLGSSRTNAEVVTLLENYMHAATADLPTAGH